MLCVTYGGPNSLPIGGITLPNEVEIMKLFRRSLLCNFRLIGQMHTDYK